VEILSLWIVIGCVYLSETLWWTASSTLVLSGSRIGAFRAQRGPALEVREGKGFFFTSPLPPFHYAFECPLLLNPEGPAKRAKRTAIHQLATQVISLARPLRLLGQGLWLYVFAIMPATIAMFGLLVVWIPLLVILLVWLAAIVITFRRSWQRLRPDARSGWRGSGALMVLSPLGAIRAADRLTRCAFADVSGLHLASVLATPEEFCRLARLTYFDATAETDDVVRSDVERLVDALRLRPAFAGPPARESGMLGFCRRCHAQVLRATGTCPDCVEQPIVPFDTDGSLPDWRAEAPLV
jgi:hypothetical protein